MANLPNTVISPNPGDIVNEYNKLVNALNAVGGGTKVTTIINYEPNQGLGHHYDLINKVNLVMNGGITAIKQRSSTTPSETHVVINNIKTNLRQQGIVV
jgi:hypothetical protein